MTTQARKPQGAPGSVGGQFTHRGRTAPVGGFKVWGPDFGDEFEDIRTDFRTDFATEPVTTYLTEEARDVAVEEAINEYLDIYGLTTFDLTDSQREALERIAEQHHTVAAYKPPYVAARYEAPVETNVKETA